MPRRSIIVLVALFVLSIAHSGRSDWWEAGVGSREPWKNLSPVSDNLIDIDVEDETERSGASAWQDAEDEVSGSGSGMDTTDDEDMMVSGSGSGDYLPDFTDAPTTRRTTPTPTTTTSTTTTMRTTSRRLTPCQQLREASQHLAGNYVPNCDSKGDYDIRQCHGQPEKGKCWCADLRGREIPGTALATDIPDCVGGTNLPRCVFQLVWQMRKTVMVTFRPQCTLDGDFESVQCKGNICYCVDQKFGDKVAGTEVFLPDRPVCNDTTTTKKDDTHEHKITLFPPGPRTTPRMVEEEMQTKVNINLEDKGGKKDDDVSEEVDESSHEVSNESGDNREPVKEPSSAASMMTQPGILAAIIGGSVVLLLCAILLAMFIIYRMKKKDEGSYPLDEPKKMPNYSYQRAPEKEFYA